MTTTTAATKTKTAKITKPNPNLQHTRQVVQTAVEYTKQCLAIVHRYIELPEAEDERQLLRDVHFITRAHYEDITEERACADLCGYPLCGNVLSRCLLQGSKGFKPAQRYHIKANKVYDISRRRNFCSDGCFRCSEHLAGQISTEPRYLRPASSASITITLLSKEETKKSGRGLPGEEVKLVDPLIKDLAEKDEEEEDEKEKEHKKSKTSTTITKLTKTTAEEVVLTDRAKVTALRADRRVETQLQSPYIKDEEFKELRGKFRRMAIKEKNISANGVALGLLPKTEEEEENEGEENDSDDDDV